MTRNLGSAPVGVPALALHTLRRLGEDRPEAVLELDLEELASRPGIGPARIQALALLKAALLAGQGPGPAPCAAADPSSVSTTHVLAQAPSLVQPLLQRLGMRNDHDLAALDLVRLRSEPAVGPAKWQVMRGLVRAARERLGVEGPLGAALAHGPDADRPWTDIVALSETLTLPLQRAGVHRVLDLARVIDGGGLPGLLDELLASLGAPTLLRLAEAVRTGGGASREPPPGFRAFAGPAPTSFGDLAAAAFDGLRPRDQQVVLARARGASPMEIGRAQDRSREWCRRLILDWRLACSPVLREAAADLAARVLAALEGRVLAHAEARLLLDAPSRELLMLPFVLADLPLPYQDAAVLALDRELVVGLRLRLQSELELAGEAGAALEVLPVGAIQASAQAREAVLGRAVERLPDGRFRLSARPVLG